MGCPICHHPSVQNAKEAFQLPPTKRVVWSLVVWWFRAVTPTYPDPVQARDLQRTLKTKHPSHRLKKLPYKNTAHAHHTHAHTFLSSQLTRRCGRHFSTQWTPRRRIEAEDAGHQRGHGAEILLVPRLNRDARDIFGGRRKNMGAFLLLDFAETEG